MPAKSQSDAEYDAAFVTALFAGVNDPNRNRAVLPPGARDSVIPLLIRLMVNAELRSAFCFALETERSRCGVNVEQRLLSDCGLDIREEEIAARGFGGLSDDELADIARSPEAILALADFLEDPDTQLGAWYADALTQEVALHPRSSDAVRRTRESLYAQMRSHDPALTFAVDRPDNIANVEEIRQTLKVVCEELRAGNAAGEISTRTIVDETRRRIHLQSAPVPTPDRLFYEVAASKLRRLIVDRARRAIQGEDTGRSRETTSLAAASAMTLPMAERAPEYVLRMDQRLDELARLDEELVQIYSLSEFAGRSPDEIAELMGALPGEITAAVEAARTELSLIE